MAGGITGGFSELRGRDEAVCIGYEIGDLVPLDRDIQVHTQPAAVPHLGRPNTALRLGFHEHLLSPRGSGAPERQAIVLLVANEPGWLTVTQALGYFRESRA